MRSPHINFRGGVRLRCPRGWYATVRFRISTYTVSETSLYFHYSYSLSFSVDTTIESSPCNTRFFLFFYNVCLGHHYAMCSAALARSVYQQTLLPTGISLGINPQPYRHYLTFEQVYRLIEFLYIVWGTFTNFRLVLRLVCC